MDLSWLLTTASLLILLYAGFTWLRGQMPRRESVSNSAPRRAFKMRSQRSKRSNAVNAGSEHQDATGDGSNAQSVQPEIAPPATPAAPGAPAGEAFTLSPRELVQLGEALTLYREGATIEQAVCRAFSVTKGGSEGWKRAKSLFDAATVPPGAAPAGTYTAAAPLKRRRRAVAR